MNIKNNQIDQIKNELNEIKVDAKSLNLSEQIERDETNTLLLTEIIENSDNLNNVLSNSEIIIKLTELKTNIINQQGILEDLIENITKKNN